MHTHKILVDSQDMGLIKLFLKSQLHYLPNQMPSSVIHAGDKIIVANSADQLTEDNFGSITLLVTGVEIKSVHDVTPAEKVASGIIVNYDGREIFATIHRLPGCEFRGECDLLSYSAPFFSSMMITSSYLTKLFKGDVELLKQSPAVTVVAFSVIMDEKKLRLSTKESGVSFGMEVHEIAKTH